MFTGNLYAETCNLYSLFYCQSLMKSRHWSFKLMQAYDLIFRSNSFKRGYEICKIFIYCDIKVNNIKLIDFLRSARRIQMINCYIDTTNKLTSRESVQFCHITCFENQKIKIRCSLPSENKADGFEK
jgi:hypothetical protein